MKKYDTRTVCPVCKRQDDRVQLIYVPLGHGRYCEYICCECTIVFPWGLNKFGNITKPEQIKKVRWVINELLDETKNQIEVSKHPDYRK